jgi:transcriptional regulator with XRE-family HTH domain
MKSNSSNDRVSAILAARRKQLNLTQKTISDYLGLKSPEHIGLIERGKRSIDLNRVPLLADIIKFDRADLTKVWLAENAPLSYAALFGESPTTGSPAPSGPPKDPSDPCGYKLETEALIGESTERGRLGEAATIQQ